MKSYLGIDVSKLHLDLSHPAPARRLANTEKAILPWLKSLPPETILVCEASGGYEALLLSLAHAALRPIIQLNARQVRDFARAKNRLAKTDRIDAGLIADFAQTFQPKALPLPDPLQEQLLALIKHRSHLLTQITQNNNLAQTLSDKHLLRLIAKTVAFLHKQVAQLEALIQTKVAASPDLLAKVNRLQEVQGIGVLTATFPRRVNA
jgi:transposase